MKTKPLTDDAGEVRELDGNDMDEMIPFAEMHPELGALLARSGDPVVESTRSAEKRSVHLRLDPEIIAHFKAMGSGWQSRINDALKELVRRGR